MSYEVYKILHVAFIFLFLSGTAVAFFAPSNPTGNKVVSGIASFLVFVAGMGLIARLNISHGEPWPMWIKAKVGIWLVLAVAAPVLAKRMRQQKLLAFGSLFVLFVAAAYVAIFKPGL